MSPVYTIRSLVLKREAGVTIGNHLFADEEPTGIVLFTKPDLTALLMGEDGTTYGSITAAITDYEIRRGIPLSFPEPAPLAHPRFKKDR